MQEILTKAFCYIAIIILGYILKQKGTFKQEDFHFLSKVVLKITLPAVIVSSFAGKTIDVSMMFITIIGFLCGMLYLVVAYGMNKNNGKEQQAFSMLNMTGYNIGNFTIPFVQSFLGSAGVITASLLDVGNVFLSLGGAYGVASMVKKGERFSGGKILKTLTKSVAFDCYIMMMVVCICKIPVPKVVLTFTEIIAAGNGFLAMFMIGIGLRIPDNLRQKSTCMRIIAMRYGMAILFATSCYYLLPFEENIRKTIVIVLFSPIASATPAFTAEIGEDVGLASAINSISVIISILFIMAILMML